ncbi:MAG: MBL fold metallo-hydrolase [Thermodesulfovibrionales bacterium]
MKMRFLGGVRVVTGSCFEVEHAGKKLLIDCGMRQGEGAYEWNRRPFPFDPASIDCVFLTHSHADHIGLVPRLVKEGFQGRIITTAPAADITEVMLYDSAHIQEQDAEHDTRRALRSGREPVAPLYTTRDVEQVLPLLARKQYGAAEDLCEGIRYRFNDAGHILGSSTLELWLSGTGGAKKLVFSGDIGKQGNPIVQDPVFVEETDYLTIESTYGTREHKDLDASVNELEQIIKATFRRRGNVIIPAFALGRTQDLLLVLNRLVKEDRLFRISVYIDSPLAERITRVYEAHPEYFDEEARRIFSTESSRAIRIRFTKSVEESMALNRIRKEAIIIAGSGMCEAGRIRHHLKHNIWRKESSIVFVGYQAEGTLGRAIVDGAKRVEIFGEEFAVQASVHTLGGFSAHAGQAELLTWISGFRNRPVVFVVHGEEKTSLEFSGLLRERFGLDARVPRIGEEVEL